MNSQTAITATKRKKSRSRPYIHQRLPCPACHFERLIDTGQHTKSLAFMASDPGYNDADYYQKCHHCKADIGIQKIE